MNDPIVDEIRRIRDAHAARFDYDLDAIFRDIKEQERKSGLNFVLGVVRQTRLIQSSEPSGPAPGGSDNSHLPHTGPIHKR